MTDGLYQKFRVERLTESSRGIDHTDCEYFVLDPKHDKHARIALYAYYRSCHNAHPDLAMDLLELLAETQS